MAAPLAALALLGSYAVTAAHNSQCSSEEAVVPSRASSLAQLQTHRHSSSTAGAIEEDNDASHESNSALCSQGKLLPELYLLGAQKCATTEFADDLMNSGVLSTGRLQPAYGDGKKEWHFFDGFYLHEDARWDVEKAQNRWLEALPPCPADSAATTSQRVILAEMTPNNLMYLPYGSGFAMSDSSANDLTKSDTINLPSTLAQFYGPLGQRLHFITLLREPLSRMQSGWYQSLTAKAVGLPGMEGTDGANFHEDLVAGLEEAEKGRLSMLMFSSMYGRQLQGFLAPFSASQFILMPYKLYTGDTQEEVCSIVSSVVGLPLHCQSPDAADRALQHNEHPSLEEEVPPNLRIRYDSFMEPENDLLVDVLLQAFLRGATLPLFHEEATQANIKAWLTSAW